ncbi:hypothetical protein CDL12_08863 [Handroanthus impetiginosus]|uniref:Uncharacterized protein n=1 Tax=Handroanthus impetiginosus TaxID=429701 RepID=A0A2G9HLS4_9LAMI|nr:hypothetical protein CDL12_08863 [Handroanthus impetiginosus]
MACAEKKKKPSLEEIMIQYVVRNDIATRTLPSNIEVYPKKEVKEWCQIIAQRSDKNLPEVMKEATPSRKEETPSTKKQKESSKAKIGQTNFKNLFEAFKRLYIAKVLKQMPNYANFMKDILFKKRHLQDYEMVALTKEYSAIIEKKLPPKLKDLDSFTIPCTIRTHFNG